MSRIPRVSRRQFLATSAAANLAFANLNAAADAPTAHLASGVKVGEVTDKSAIVWTRVTAGPARVSGKKVIGKVAKGDQPAVGEANKLEGACPGAAGRVRVRYGTKADLSDAKTTDWAEVTEKTDYNKQFAIDGLPANTVIHYAIDTAEPALTVRFMVR